ncbi:hypothetical protein NC653_041515 [Populus alba x Populus x berolinensis]|uniref:Uncharacterized protein n=1 Tax=Populus alba x Populus x berolinensis TaxID=444605 RepID=A0AAD6L8T8_9ROSI|nr:hypothetical protein NC653_041515 [Populus alba x Populus x berolinensis]
MLMSSTASSFFSSKPLPLHRIPTLSRPSSSPLNMLTFSPLAARHGLQRPQSKPPHQKIKRSPLHHPWNLHQMS